MPAQQSFPLPSQDQSQNADPNVNVGESGDTQESTQEQIPPTNQPPVPPTDNQDRYVQLLEETLREQAAQLRAQSSRLESIDERLNNPPAPPEVIDPEEERQRYYANPKEETRKIVKDLLDESIRPLTQFVQEMRGQTVAQKAIERVKNDPRFASHWDANVEGAVTAAISSIPPANVNDQFVQAAVIQAIGMKHAGLFGAPTAPHAPAPTPNNPPANTNGGSVTTPPHMRPSNPAAPRQNNTKPQPVLTELEARLARERGMTPEQYVHWRDMPASEVAFTDYGKPQR